MDISFLGANIKVISVTRAFLLWLYLHGCIANPIISKRGIPEEQLLDEKSNYYSCVVRNCSHNEDIQAFWSCVNHSCHRKKHKGLQKRWIDTSYYLQSRRSLNKGLVAKCREISCRDVDVCGDLCEQLRGVVNKRSPHDAKWPDQSVFGKARSLENQKWKPRGYQVNGGSRGNDWGSYYRSDPYTEMGKRDNILNVVSERNDYSSPKRWLDPMTYKKDRSKVLVPRLVESDLRKRSQYPASLKSVSYYEDGMECESCPETEQQTQILWTLEYCLNVCGQNEAFNENDIYHCVDACSQALSRK